MTSTRRIPSRPCRPAHRTGPGCGICDWTTCPRRAWPAWSPRCCTPTRPRRAQLARMIGPRTAGNPYETVELLDALRRARLLTPTAGGWQWDDAAVRAHLGEAAATLSAARITALPPPSRAWWRRWPAWAGEPRPACCRTPPANRPQWWTKPWHPPCTTACWWPSPTARPAVRFRHDRLREDILAGLDPSRRHELQLGMARRLADAPDLFAVAAEQYLPVTDAVDDPAERRRVVGLLRHAAEQARLIGDHARVNTLLDAALPLIDLDDTATLAAAHTGPPCRPLQPGTTGRGRRGVPHHRAPARRRCPESGGDGCTGAQPDPPKALPRCDRARARGAAGARHRRPGGGPDRGRPGQSVRSPVPLARAPTRPTT